MAKEKTEQDQSRQVCSWIGSGIGWLIRAVQQDSNRMCPLSPPEISKTLCVSLLPCSKGCSKCQTLTKLIELDFHRNLETL